MDRALLEREIDAALMQPDNEWRVYSICKRLGLSPEACLESIQEMAPDLPRKTLLLGVDEYRHSGWPELFARQREASLTA